MTATDPAPPPAVSAEALDLAVELHGWHDNLDEATSDGMPIRVYREGGESEQTRLNMRAALREASALLRLQANHIAGLKAEVARLRNPKPAPAQIAAAWRAFRGGRPGSLLGPGPGFVEAIGAALSVREGDDAR